MTRPTLVIVCGPAGSGKTTLAHTLARSLGWPAVCRDEIKEGMALRGGGPLQPQPGDALIRQASELFFRVLRLLVEGGVSTVAEAAFQHQIWVKSLEPSQMLAQVRVVDCHVDPSVARHRILSRPPRSAHADVQLVAALEAGDAYLEDFERLRLGVPSIKVDTSTDYRPTIDAVASFVRGG